MSFFPLCITKTMYYLDNWDRYLRRSCIYIMPRILLILGVWKLLYISLPFYLLDAFVFIYFFWHAYLALTCNFQVFRHAHPGSPYVFGLVGVDHDLDFPEPMPVVGMNKLSLSNDCFCRHYALSYPTRFVAYLYGFHPINSWPCLLFSMWNTLLCIIRYQLFEWNDLIMVNNLHWYLIVFFLNDGMFG